MHRRKFVTGLAAVAGVGFTGCGGRRSGASMTRGASDATRGSTPTSDTPTETDAESVADAWGFDDVVDVTSVGADPNGERPIDDVLDEYAEDDTLLSFPRGRYALEDVFQTTVANLGLLGDDTTIVPPDEYDDTLFEVGHESHADRLYISGFEFDFTAERTGGRPLLAKAHDIYASDMTVTGEADVEQDLFRFDVTDPDGSGHIQHIFLPDGALSDSKVTGIEVGDDNRGDLSFVDCHVAGFPDNGLYADPPEGSVRVLGGTYLNNGIAGVRVEAEDGLVRGVHVRCDEGEDAGENMRGIRLRNGQSLVVEDCIVELLDVTTSDGGVVFSSELDRATVRNCDIHIDADGVNAIRLKSASDSASMRGPFRCENIKITGEAADGAAVQAANRNGCLFRNLYVHQSGENRDGIVADNVHGNLKDSYISVTGEPIRFTNSRITRRNVTVDPMS